MDIEVRIIERLDYEKAHAFQCEYLDTETFSDFEHKITENPDLYFVALDGNELVGVCYGHPSKKDESAIGLQGIAVNLDSSKKYARMGIGSRMIRVFEEAVKHKGYKKISLGSADDQKVEHFYLRNRFKPCELLAKGPDHEHLERVKITDYESGKITREELRMRNKAREVIFIFEKCLE